MKKNNRNATTTKERFEINLCLLIEREIKRRKIGRDNVLRSVQTLIGNMYRPSRHVYSIRPDASECC